MLAMGWHHTCVTATPHTARRSHWAPHHQAGFVQQGTGNRVQRPTVGFLRKLEHIEVPSIQLRPNSSYESVDAAACHSPHQQPHHQKMHAMVGQEELEHTCPHTLSRWPSSTVIKSRAPSVGENGATCTGDSLGVSGGLTLSRGRFASLLSCQSNTSQQCYATRGRPFTRGMENHPP